MSNLMAMLNTGLSGIMAAQVQLDVTGHNIANLNNKNYSRQRVEVVSAYAMKSKEGTYGQGVKTVGVVRIYDEILTRTLRNETSSLAYWANNQQGLDSIQVYFNELETGSGLGEHLLNYFNAWQDLSVIPPDNSDESYIKRTQVLATAEELCAQIQNDYAMFRQLKDNINENLKSAVSEINAIAESIAKLNSDIVRVEADGSHANDLRDTRDALVNTVAQMAGINVTERPNGEIAVYIAGEPIVDGARAFKLELELREDGEYDVIWRASNIDKTSTVISNRIAGGTMQSDIYLRDTLINKYTKELDELVKTLIYETNKIHASGQGLARFTELTATNSVASPRFPIESEYGNLPYPLQEGTFQIKIYDAEGVLAATQSVSIDPKTDTLNGIAEKISTSGGDILNGTIQSYVDYQGYLQIRVTEGYTFSFGEDTSGFLVAAGFNNFFSGTDSSNISVDSHIKTNIAYISTSVEGDVGDNEIAKAIVEVQFKSVLEGGITISDFYGYFIGRIASEKQQTDLFVATKEMSVASYEEKVQAVSGVSESEETANLIIFEKMLQANARFINAVDEMLDIIVNNLGLVGR
ncbi:MAG: flagellar hook-associated protein FlgK [Deferribacteraceae bacterium]|jgi:flagellar hook-associated protein 1 FlgK|nr:flagellar hook-associated protein FlgK [Deferribacteraceae bacterium]